MCRGFCTIGLHFCKKYTIVVSPYMYMYHVIFRREALILWKQKLGSSATYNELIRAFERAGYKEYADNVRKVVQPQDYDDEMDSSSSDEDCFSSSQPPTYLEPSSPVDMQLSKPESYLLMDNPAAGEKI